MEEKLAVNKGSVTRLAWLRRSAEGRTKNKLQKEGKSSTASAAWSRGSGTCAGIGVFGPRKRASVSRVVGQANVLEPAVCLLQEPMPWGWLEGSWGCLCPQVCRGHGTGSCLQPSPHEPAEMPSCATSPPSLHLWKMLVHVLHVCWFIFSCRNAISELLCSVLLVFEALGLELLGRSLFFV